MYKLKIFKAIEYSRDYKSGVIGIGSKTSEQYVWITNPIVLLNAPVNCLETTIMHNGLVLNLFIFESYHMYIITNLD